jgi:DNA-binding NarL/FixJ family response regulator
MNLDRALGHEVGSSPMSDGTPIVFVVDDDVSVRESLELLIRCEGWQPEIFASAQEFLSRPRVLVPSCLILDVSLPGLNGLDLQKRIASDRIDMPIIGRETPPATCAESLTLPATGRSPLVLRSFIHTKLESQVDFLRPSIPPGFAYQNRQSQC